MNTLRIACVLDEFPVLSETFILNQIYGLIDRHCEIDLYAFSKRDASQAHPNVQKYRLMDRFHCAKPMPASIGARLCSAASLALKHGWRHPRITCGAFNLFRHGHLARSMRLIHQASAFMNAPRYDLVHCHFGHVGQQVARLRQLGLMPGPLVVSFYGFDISQRPLMEPPDYYQTLFQQATAVLALSRVMADQLTRQGCPENKIHIHHLGVDANRFEFRPRTKHKDEPTRLLSIARLVEKKGLTYAIDALSKVARQRQDFHYHIIGDGPLKQSLQQQINHANLQDRIQLLGWRTQDQVRQALNQAHILLAPSVTAARGDQEGTPTAIVEAMMMGLPILSTNHSGIPEMIQDGRSGYLVPERDADALADKLIELLEHPRQGAVLGRCGSAFAREHFNIDKLNDQMIQHYHQWINASHTPQTHATQKRSHA